MFSDYLVYELSKFMNKVTVLEQNIMNIINFDESLISCSRMFMNSSWTL